MTGAGTGGGGGQGPPDGTDPEDAEKCPICLSALSGAELAMPDSCCHVFCLRCLLTWAELQASPSCPVDRRPFNNLYRWDGHLSCVQVPVRRRVAQPAVESYCRRNSQYKTGLNSKRALRQKKVERTVDGKSKGLVRKCNDEDPSSLTRKKVRGAESCSWSPPAFVSLTTTTHEIAQSVDDEEVMLGHTVQHCKPQSCVWFSSAAPVSTGTSTMSFHPSIRNTGAFPFALSSSPFSSSPVSGSSHFVFEGVVCAITCPKGGEKKGGRASKAAPKQTAAKRSSRGAKTQEEAPLSDPPSPQTSGASDSDNPHSTSRQGRAAQAVGKRKGKQVTNRKASGKRKAPARKKRAAEVISSSEEEEEDATKNNTEDEQEGTKPESLNSKQDQEKNGDNAEDSEPEIAAEESLNDDQNDSNQENDQEKPLINDVSQDSSDTQDKHESDTEEKVEIPSSPLNSAPNSPTPTNEDNHSVKEEDEEEAEEANTSPKLEQEDMISDDEKRLSPKQEEMDISDNEDDEDKASTGAESVGKTEFFAQTEDTKDEMSEAKAEEKDGKDLLQSESPRQSEAMSESGDAASRDRDESELEKAAEKETKNSTEDTNEIPMDFGSPLSEHGSGKPLEKEDLCPEVSESSDDKPKEEASKTEEKPNDEKRDRDKSSERSRPRRSRFHSPTTSWSPKRESKDSRRDKRSRSRERNGSPSRSARRSRERERDGDYHRRERDRSRERSRERRRRRSRSRSRSRSRNRSYKRSDRSPEREDRREERREERREDSPSMNDRRGGWRSGGEGRKYGGGRFENGLQNDESPERSVVDSNPDWVEKQRSCMSSSSAPRWEDQSRGRGRGGRGGFDRGRGRGSGNRSFYNQEEQSENRWQPRNNFSGTGSAAGSDAYSRFNENRGGRRKEMDSGETMDRSGWSSASSWAVRRTLPADVQDYYSKRERGGPSGWSRQEEETTPSTDPPKSEPPAQTVPGNAPVPVLMSAHPQLLHHYPTLPGARGPVSVSLQPAAPYALPPSQVPVHLHTAVPLLQVPAVGAQGLPPPPPPPPPMQQGSQTAAAQADGHSTQMVGSMGGFAKPLFPTPTKVTQVAPMSTQALPSSTTQPQHNRAQADSSKKEKKQQIQEQAINEVKNAMKPYYQKKEITKEEYKEIVRKAVEKVCHSKSGEVNSSKVANLVKAYVDKYKHARKK